ncbi:hypothetical protein [Nonomuraea endophytica]|uniref:Mannitol-specific phosphotransferase system IIBC component n=1 Tax=Nonomuraea endophytica TaxID=714136 RepID=A0A7W8A0T2_9ACTN|nr:hypothetical protein [Nonomuraea endophytica]MBB5077446.1 mannitol-specific phosphotransferase system IIBC component [Nonomuraea endophytica]
MSTIQSAGAATWAPSRAPGWPREHHRERRGGRVSTIESKDIRKLIVACDAGMGSSASIMA